MDGCWAQDVRFFTWPRLEMEDPLEAIRRILSDFARRHKLARAHIGYEGSFECVAPTHNAGEVMAWLKDGPLPRLYIEEHRREMRAALNQLVKRGLVKSIGRGAGGACYRTDRPKHVDRARNLARFCRALVHVDPRERRILGEWI